MSTSFIIRLLETRAARDLIIEIKLIKNLSLPKSNRLDINFDVGKNGSAAEKWRRHRSSRPCDN